MSLFVLGIIHEPPDIRKFKSDINDDVRSNIFGEMKYQAFYYLQAMWKRAFFVQFLTFMLLIYDRMRKRSCRTRFEIRP